MTLIFTTNVSLTLLDSEQLYIWIMSNENIKLISDLIDYIDVNNSTCNNSNLDQIRKVINIIQIQYSFFSTSSRKNNLLS
jgi:hypothetical protein